MTKITDWARHFMLRPTVKDLTIRQIAMLGVLQKNGPTQTKEVARILGVSKPVVTRAANTLAKEGLTARSYDQQDRRLCYVGLTNRGQELVEEIDA